MHVIHFLRLLHTLYGTRVPDIALIQKLGLLAVNIGQVYALRPDFLSEDKCRELAKLYRHTDAVSPARLESLLQSTLGDLQQFTAFDRVPVASASVGQVHKAVLQTGETVAVKLIKKNAANEFTHDVRRVQRMFNVAIFFYPKLSGVANPSELLGQIEKFTLAELDLRNELAGYEELEGIARKHQELFKDLPIGFVKTYPALSTESVLVTEFLDGVTLDEMLEAGTLPYKQLLKLFYIQGLYTYLEGTFHGDIHPGNIMMVGDRFYFVDAGYIGKVNEKIRVNLLNFFEHLSLYDYTKAAYYLNKMSEIEIQGKAYTNFERAFLELYKDFAGKPVGEMSLTKKMMQTIRLGVNSGMRFSEGMFDIIKSHMYLDGMAIRCNPKAILLEDMRPFVKEYRTLLARYEIKK